MDLIYFLFLQTIKLSIMTTITAVIIFFIKKLLKNRFSPGWHYYIWFLIVIRLLIPYSFSSPVSIFNLLDSNNKMQINTVNIQTKEQNANINISTEEKEDKYSEQNKFYFITQILSIVWIFVIIILIIYVLSVYLSFAIRVKRGAELKDEETRGILKSCKKSMQIKSHIPIVETRRVKSPCIFGIFNPVILFPGGIINILSKEDKKYIFIHELVHFKRKDNLISMIFTILNIIHWFNPVLYFFFKKVKIDCEIACDAKALSYIKFRERKNYGETIINLAQYVSLKDIKPWMSGVANKSDMKRRIIMISKFKRNTAFKVISGVITAVLVCVIAFTYTYTRSDNKAKEAKNQSSDVAGTNTKNAIDNNASDNNTANNTASSNNIADNEKTTSNKTISNSAKSSSSNSAAKTSSDAKASTTNKSTAVNKSETEKTTSNTSSQNAGKSRSETEEYTRQEAANAALNYELQGNLKSSAVETYKGENYASFSSGDLGVTVFDSMVIDGKTYYSVRLASKQMRENGGSGTVDHFYIAKDGSIKR